MAKRREKYTDLIDSLERVMFPYQESEEEQESFTPEGRRRVDRWIEEHVICPCERRSTRISPTSTRIGPRR